MIFKIPKVPQSFSRDQVIEGLTKQYGRLLFLELTGKAKNKEFYECLFNFQDLRDASKLLMAPQPCLLIDGTVLIF